VVEDCDISETSDIRYTLIRPGGSVYENSSLGAPLSEKVVVDRSIDSPGFKSKLVLIVTRCGFGEAEHPTDSSGVESLSRVNILVDREATDICICTVA
jgi:hypothetical protein